MITTAASALIIPPFGDLSELSRFARSRRLARDGSMRRDPSTLSIKEEMADFRSRAMASFVGVRGSKEARMGSFVEFPPTHSSSMASFVAFHRQMSTPRLPFWQSWVRLLAFAIRSRRSRRSSRDSTSVDDSRHG
jgi:hypothetical protein